MQLPSPIASLKPENQLHNLSEILLDPYQTKFTPLPVEVEPGTILIVHPQVKPSNNCYLLCVKVNNDQTIPCPITNNTKVTKTFKVGTLFGWYEKGEVNSPLIRHIQNYLLPHSDQVSIPGGCKEKLNHLLSKLPMSHLKKTQKTELNKVILANDQLFLLEEGELGTLNVPLVGIEVTDARPVRTPMYRYPETSKEIISQMLEDMEARRIIEKSTSAWLSAIVLVNKPDGSKQMCLDYRQVNTDLATDIYPLPRLNELVEQDSDQDFYTTLDLKEAYFQVTIHEHSKDITTFSDGIEMI